MRIILFSMLASLATYASPNWISQQSVDNGNVGAFPVKVFTIKAKCELETGALCFDLIQGEGDPSPGQTWDIRTHKLIGGQFIHDSGLQAVLDAQVANAAQKAQDILDRLGRLATSDTDIDAANGIPDIKQILKDLANEIKSLRNAL